MCVWWGFWLVVVCCLFFCCCCSKINTATDLTVIQVSTKQPAEEPSLKMAATHHFYHFSAGLKTHLGFNVHWCCHRRNKSLLFYAVFRKLHTGKQATAVQQEAGLPSQRGSNGGHLSWALSSHGRPQNSRPEHSLVLQQNFFSSHQPSLIPQICDRTGLGFVWNSPHTCT